MSALLRRLADDDLDVVAAALSSKALLQLPAAGLFQAVEGRIAQVWEALQGKDQSVSSGNAQTVIKNVSNRRFPVNSVLQCLHLPGTFGGSI